MVLCNQKLLYVLLCMIYLSYIFAFASIIVPCLAMHELWLLPVKFNS